MKIHNPDSYNPKHTIRVLTEWAATLEQKGGKCLVVPFDAFFHEKRNSEKNRRLQGIEAFEKWVYVCVYGVEKPSMAEDVIEICRGLQEIR